MCQWNNTKAIFIDNRIIDVDSCIADLVDALNKCGLKTVASCCGHGKQPGTILLKDGREVRIFSSWEDGRKVDKLFPPINT